MSPLSTLARTLPLPPLSPAEQQALAEWLEVVRSCGYDEAGLNELLGVPDLHHIWMKEVFGLRRRCRGSLRGALAARFLLGEEVEAPRPVEVLGKLSLDGACSLWPCLGLHVLTDPFITEVNFQHAVYRLGGDSYALARLTPRRPVRRALDLCTGSGIHALLASRHAEEALGVDINPRAVQFARLNARMNGCDAEFVQGDLYAPCRGVYDLITCNPPFVPTPEANSELFRSGGADGEDLVKRIVAGLGTWLAPQGLFAMVTHYPVMDPPLISRLRSWLGPGEWGIGVLNYARFTNERYVAMNLRSDLPVAVQTDAFLDCYEALGIRGVVEAVTFIRRGVWFEAERDLPLPSGSLSHMTEAWLGALASPAPSAVVRHPELARLLVDEGGAGVALHHSRGWAPGGVALSAAEVSALQGGAASEEVRKGLAVEVLAKHPDWQEERRTY